MQEHDLNPGNSSQDDQNKDRKIQPSFEFGKFNIGLKNDAKQLANRTNEIEETKRFIHN